MFFHSSNCVPSIIIFLLQVVLDFSDHLKFTTEEKNHKLVKWLREMRTAVGDRNFDHKSTQCEEVDGQVRSQRCDNAVARKAPEVEPELLMLSAEGVNRAVNAIPSESANRAIQDKTLGEAPVIQR